MLAESQGYGLARRGSGAAPGPADKEEEDEAEEGEEGEEEDAAIQEDGSDYEEGKEEEEEGEEEEDAVEEDGTPPNAELDAAPARGVGKRPRDEAAGAAGGPPLTRRRAAEGAGGRGRGRGRGRGSGRNGGAPQPAPAAPKLGCSKCRWASIGCKACRPGGGAEGDDAAAAAAAAHLEAEVKEKEASGSGGSRARGAQAPGSAANVQQQPGERLFDFLRRKARRAQLLAGGGGGGSAAAGPLQGLTVLVTGFSGADDKAAAWRSVRRLGGRVVADVAPPPPPLPGRSPRGAAPRHAPPRRAASGGGDDAAGATPLAAVDLAVAGAAHHTPKYMSAVARGVPILTSDWLDACAAAGKLLDPDACAKRHVLVPARPELRGAPLLAGLRVYVFGQASFRSTFSDVLGHAGARGRGLLVCPAASGIRHSAVPLCAWCDPRPPPPTPDAIPPSPPPAPGALSLPEIAGPSMLDPCVEEALVDAIVYQDAPPEGPLAPTPAKKLDKKGATGKGARRGSAGAGASGSSPPPSPAKLARRLQELRRAARALRLPVLPHPQLLTALVDAELPPVLAALAAGGEGQAGGGSGRGAAAPVAAPPPLERATPRKRRSPAKAPVSGGGGGGGAARKIRRVGSVDEEGAAEKEQGTPAKQLRAAGQEEWATPPRPRASPATHAASGAGSSQPRGAPAQAPLGAAAGSGSPLTRRGSPGSAAAWQPPRLEWDGPPVAPPDGAAHQHHRTFYGGLRLLPPPVAGRASTRRGGGAGGAPVGDPPVVRPGGALVLQPLPGDALPQVVRVLALWQEVPADGRPRMFARCARYYRPAETIFPLPGPQLFASDDVANRVPLAGAVLAAARVSDAPPSPGAGPPSAASGVAAASDVAAGGVPLGCKGGVPLVGFQCSFYYDHEGMALRGAASGGGAGRG
jgi:hypothetical protein